MLIAYWTKNNASCDPKVKILVVLEILSRKCDCYDFFYKKMLDVTLH